MGVGAGRVGLILFDGSGAYTTISLGDYNNRTDLYNKINGLLVINRTDTADNALGITKNQPSHEYDRDFLLL